MASFVTLHCMLHHNGVAVTHYELSAMIYSHFHDDFSLHLMQV